MTCPYVDIAERNSVAWLTLRRPEKPNAIRAQMWGSIRVGLIDLPQREDIRVLAIQGSDGCFATGKQCTDDVIMAAEDSSRRSARGARLPLQRLAGLTAT